MALETVYLASPLGQTCHAVDSPLLQRLQQMLPNLVWPNRQCSGCSPYASAMAKAVVKRPQSAARGTRYGYDIGSRGPIILPWRVWGDRFWGGKMTPLPLKNWRNRCQVNTRYDTGSLYL